MGIQVSQAAAPLPADLQAILDDLAKTDSEARQLIEGLNDAQLNWQPKGGAGWSIAQCLYHLARTNAIYTAALYAAVSNVKPGSKRRRRPIQPGWFERYFIRSMDAPPRRRFTAPKKARPGSHESGDEVLRAFLLSHEEIRALITECAEIDLNRIRFKNPFIGIFRFTVGTGLLVMMAHDRRHLWQAKQVRSSLQSQVQ